jgi:hypothetical protein
MEYDRDKVDEIVMALMYLTMSERRGVIRSWKGYDWDAMDRLFEKGWIMDPKNKARSVVVTEAGQAKAAELFQKHFSPSA